jgi:hypothetical protein
MRQAIVVLTVFFLGFVTEAVGQTTTVQITIQSVKPEAKEITVGYKTNLGDKTITLDVSRKAEITLNGEEVDLASLVPGLSGSVEYNQELEIVTKIVAAGELPNGWRFIDLEGSGTVDPETALIVTRDGTLICRKNVRGWYLLSERRYPAMLFSVEYKYIDAQSKSGAIVVATPGPSEGSKGMPFGFEIKLGAGTCGQMELPRVDYRVELPLGQIRDGRRVTQTRLKEPIVGQWNKLEIECNQHNNVVVKLNGEVINAVAKAEDVTGKIAIWPMNSEIHFRNATITIDGKEEKLEFDVNTGK